jgi:hypothetical protein
LVLKEAFRDAAVERLRLRLTETGNRLEQGSLFLEYPKQAFGSSNVPLLIRDSSDLRTDALVRRFALIPRDVAMAIKTKEGMLYWASAHFCELAARPLSMITGKGSHQIWPDRYGEVIFNHDREVADTQEPTLFSEALWVGQKLKSRMAIRFPLRLRAGGIEKIGVIGFNPILTSRIA